MYLKLIIKDIICELYTSRLPDDILYKNVVTMYIGNLCDGGRFHSMGFLETPFITINFDLYALCSVRNKVILIIFIVILNCYNVLFNYKKITRIKTEISIFIFTE